MRLVKSSASFVRFGARFPRGSELSLVAVSRRSQGRGYRSLSTTFQGEGKASGGNQRLAVCSGSSPLRWSIAIIRATPRTSFHSGTAFFTGLVPNLYPDVDLPEVPLPEHIFSNTERFNNDVAMVNAVTGASLTFLEYKDAIYRVSSGLARHGLKKGDVLVLFGFNSPEYSIVFHAAMAIGVTVSPANPGHLADDLTRQIKDCGASFICTDKEGTEKVRKSCVDTNQIKKVFVLDKEGVEGTTSFSELLNDDGDARPSKVDINVYKDIVLLPYSSGTTGVPKGVVVTHHNTVSSMQQTKTKEFWLKREGTVVLNVLPYFHIFGYITNLCLSFHFGQKQILLPRFEPQLFLSSIEKYQVELAYVVPPMLLFLVKDPLTKNYDLSSLKQLTCGAAPVREELGKEFMEKFPHVFLTQAYGLTETGPALSVTPVAKCKDNLSAAGALVPNTEGKFIDVETGKSCGPNQQGELLVRGPQNMPGYLNKPDATAETIDAEGWLHTGDIGYYNEEGMVFIVDRRKELIKYKGTQVAPAELEGLLLEHPAVADSGVTSIPDDAAGELPVGYVVLKPGHVATEQELANFVAERTASYKRLRGGVVIVDNIPKSPSGKILRRILKEMAAGRAQT